MFNIENNGISIFKRVILRIGGFHIVFCMIPTIYSRFKYAWIAELLRASGLGDRGSITKTLKDGDTKKTINVYEFLFEALLWY